MTTPGDQFRTDGWGRSRAVDQGPLGVAVHAVVASFYGGAPGGSWAQRAVDSGDGRVSVSKSAAAVPSPDPSVEVVFLSVASLRMSGSGVDVLADVTADGFPRVCLVSLERGQDPGTWVVDVAPGFFP